MRPVVRDLYKQILVVGRAYPAGLDAVRDRAKREFRERADLRSGRDQESRRYRRYMLREMRALIQLKKYRTLKAGLARRRSGEMVAGVRGDVDSTEDAKSRSCSWRPPTSCAASLHVPGRPRSSPAEPRRGRPAAALRRGGRPSGRVSAGARASVRGPRSCCATPTVLAASRRAGCR